VPGEPWRQAMARGAVAYVSDREASRDRLLRAPVGRGGGVMDADWVGAFLYVDGKQVGRSVRRRAGLNQVGGSLVP
jgi:hypothetical protein